jgi:hypothetical protein
VGFSFNGQSKKKKEVFFTIQFVESSLSLGVQMNDKSFSLFISFPFFLLPFFWMIDHAWRGACGLQTRLEERK